MLLPLCHTQKFCGNSVSLIFKQQTLSSAETEGELDLIDTYLANLDDWKLVLCSNCAILILVHTDLVPLHILPKGLDSKDL